MEVRMLRSFLLSGILAVAAAPAFADVTLFENVRVFDGSGPELTAPVNVLVRDRLIERISPDEIAPEAGATIIDGGGGTLMPGLIDAHWHAMLVRPTPAESIYGDVGFNNLIAGDEATDTLMRGFTTVRDMGGPVFGLKQAIDAGHGDFRQLAELPRTLGAPSSPMEKLGGSMVADSPDEVRVRAREQLMQGASQIRLTAGGGVASPHSPLDVSTFTEAELRAAVEAAGNWGTYVAVHAYTSEAIQRAIAAGVKVIEHGHLMDDATARLMAEQDIWLSTQPFVDDEDAVQFPPGSAQAARKQEVTGGTESVYALAKKHGIRTAFGTDILFSPALATRQGAWLARMVRWYTPAEALKMATRDNAELLALTGLRNPYPGRLGVVEEGALADLLLVDGDPIADIDLLADPGNLDVIMKDGRIYKNTRPGA
jgi:imidazolonepropionase-like amidohydrolase